MQQIQADVAIIGGGTAGLAAAVAAAEGDVSVVIFEKASTTGGAGNMASGPLAIESKLQRIKKIALTREEAFKIHMDFTHWRVNARLVKAYYNKSASTIDWLEKLGVEFVDVGSHNPGFQYTWHIIKGTDSPSEQTGAAATMIKILTLRAKELGVNLLLRTPAKNIFKKGTRIAGVIAEDESGESIQANTKAVIIATGGFGDNPEWIKKYTGYESGHDVFVRRIPGLAGDGIRIAWEAGAAATEMSLQNGCGVHDLQGSFAIGFVFMQPGLMVNLSGERFMNEEIIQTTPFGPNPIAAQKNRCGFVIIDEDTRKHYEEAGPDFSGPLPSYTGSQYTNFDADIKRAIDQGSKDLFIADSLPELADKIGIKQDALLETVDEYNHACEIGRDEIFQKNPRYLRPVKKPRFYAGRLTLDALGTLGGIKINHKTEVLSNNSDVIPGLYAAGLDANSIYGDTYVFVLPGNTLGFAINSGRMAGENAAEYARLTSS